MGCASFTVAALNCLKSAQNRRLPSFFFYHDDRRGPRTVGGADDAIGQHLLDLCHLHPSNSGDLAVIWLAKWGSVGLDDVFQERCTAKVVLSLANDVAEFLEEVLHLLLLSW